MKHEPPVACRRTRLLAFRALTSDYCLQERIWSTAAPKDADDRASAVFSSIESYRNQVLKTLGASLPVTCRFWRGGKAAIMYGRREGEMRCEAAGRRGEGRICAGCWACVC